MIFLFALANIFSLFASVESNKSNYVSSIHFQLALQTCIRDTDVSP